SGRASLDADRPRCPQRTLVLGSVRAQSPRPDSRGFRWRSPFCRIRHVPPWHRTGFVHHPAAQRKFALTTVHAGCVRPRSAGKSSVLSSGVPAHILLRRQSAPRTLPLPQSYALQISVRHEQPRRDSVNPRNRLLLPVRRRESRRHSVLPLRPAHSPTADCPLTLRPGEVPLLPSLRLNQVPTHALLAPRSLLRPIPVHGVEQRWCLTLRVHAAKRVLQPCLSRDIRFESRSA